MIDCVYCCVSDVVAAAGFDSLLLCPAFTDFEFMNWSAEGGTGEVRTVPLNLRNSDADLISSCLHSVVNSVYTPSSCNRHYCLNYHMTSNL